MFLLLDKMQGEYLEGIESAKHKFYLIAVDKFLRTTQN
jgi:hypothetical protein